MVSREVDGVPMGRKKRDREAFGPLARWLLDQLRERNLSERQASDGAGLDHGAISRYVAGTQASPENCGKLADFFGVAREQVLYLAGHINPPPDHDLFVKQVGALAREWSQDRKRRFLKLAEHFE